ncbi:alpha-L RNA-binding motif-containing protein [Rhodotorula sp. JG-1b]|nr:alpha-L RNA-binding motif-containing protein [Rhodotorula sp. JG-1b]
MGHVPANPTSILKCLPRMSWSPANLYNLYQRTYGPQSNETRFTKSSFTLFQQKWKAKQLVRAYHGDILIETKFKRHYLPDELPPIVGTNPGDLPVPLASLMFAEVEKRIDTVVFRCCFADSIYKARQMVLHGKVQLNGRTMTDPNRKLQPGDLISVDPTAVVTLQRPREPPASASASSSDAAAAESATSEAGAATAESASESESSSTTTPPPPSAAGARPLPFHLPDYAAPFLFIPPYIEPSFQTCSAVYLRHPTARPGVSEIPSPYEADGEVMRLAWEYYLGMGRKGDVKKSKKTRGQRLGA